jgi:hypothetical protein
VIRFRSDSFHSDTFHSVTFHGGISAYMAGRHLARDIDVSVRGALFLDVSM